MRLGIAKSQNYIFYLSLLSAFAILDFVLDRMRLGIAKSQNYIFYLSLLSAFTIFVAIRPGDGCRCAPHMCSPVRYGVVKLRIFSKLRR